jgi:hypothetical protein
MSNLNTIKESKIMMLQIDIKSFMESHCLQVEVESFLAILARIQILKMQNISHQNIDYVFQVAESWLTFGEDCLLLYETLKQEILAKTSVEDVLTVVPDFSTIYKPARVSTGYLVKTLREVTHA